MAALMVAECMVSCNSNTNKPTQAKIEKYAPTHKDTLQLFRYSIQKAENINQFNKEYMRKINRTPHTDVKYSERAIEANPYQYTEKLEFIEAELLKALQKARTKK